MASAYPNSLDSFATNHQDGVQEVIHASSINDLDDAVNKIEAEIGALPKGTYPTIRARLDSLETVIFNSQTVSPYTLQYSSTSSASSDASKTIVCISGAAFTLYIPSNTTAPFPIGTVIAVRQGGAGQVTIAGAIGGSVTVVNPFNSLLTFGQNAEVRLLKNGTNAWSVNGEVA